MNMTLDVNSELYPLSKDESISVQITSTLSDELKDAAEYIMYGKVYRFDEGKGEKTYLFYYFLFVPKLISQVLYISALVVF